GLGSLTVAGGPVDFSPAGGPVTLAVPSLTLISGTLTGTDSFTVAGDFLWGNGALKGTGTVTANGLTTPDNATLENGRFVNNGNVVWTTSWIYVTNAAIDNFGTFEARFDTTNGAGLRGFGSATFRNSNGATLLKTGDGGTFIGMPFTNGGTV